MTRRKIENWVRPTLQEVRETINSLDKKDIIYLLGVRRNAIYEWLRGDKNISRSNWLLLCLYRDGVVDIDGKGL